MSEEGTLSIVRRGRGYQVRYASNNPYDPERPLHACPDEETLSGFLCHLGLEACAIREACAAVQTGGVAVLRFCSRLTATGLLSPALSTRRHDPGRVLRRVPIGRRAVRGRPDTRRRLARRRTLE